LQSVEKQTTPRKALLGGFYSVVIDLWFHLHESITPKMRDLVALIQPFSLLQQLQVSQTILMLNLRMRNFQSAGCLSMKQRKELGI